MGGGSEEVGGLRIVLLLLVRPIMSQGMRPTLALIVVEWRVLQRV